MKERRRLNSGRLTPKQLRFLEAYAKGISVTEAAKEAGYGAVRNVLDNVNVAKALQEVQTKVMEKVGYSLEKAMQETDEAIEFAKMTKNANAYMKGLEIKAKLNGLLIEKHQHLGAAGFQVQIVGIGQSEQKQMIEVVSTPVIEQKLDLEQLAIAEPKNYISIKEKVKKDKNKNEEEPQTVENKKFDFSTNTEQDKKMNFSSQTIEDLLV